MLKARTGSGLSSRISERKIKETLCPYDLLDSVFLSLYLEDSICFLWRRVSRILPSEIKRLLRLGEKIKLRMRTLQAACLPPSVTFPDDFLLYCRDASRFYQQRQLHASCPMESLLLSHMSFGD
ncbi:hypothetical protein SAY87_011055 [Trapa incisa]|uniref:Uncharacterized protein n=1 Tax=Trapa incisa TaxID=236973 RepID=A0AAN7JIW3_9MYRT|nr:hypothetical protein SAY87_011055 [Trapa incisa]